MNLNLHISPGEIKKRNDLELIFWLLEIEPWKFIPTLKETVVK